MNPEKYRECDYNIENYYINANPKNKKGKEAKTWEPQYKSIWSGKKR